MRIVSVVLPAAVLGIVGGYLGFYAKDGLEGAAVSGLAGLIGGGVAGFAALGVIGRARSKGEHGNPKSL